MDIDKLIKKHQYREIKTEYEHINHFYAESFGDNLTPEQRALHLFFTYVNPLGLIDLCIKEKPQEETEYWTKSKEALTAIKTKREHL